MPRKLYLAAYDIRHPKRLRRALKATRAYASGGQKSAHECWLGEADVRALLADVRQWMHKAQDSFALIPLDPRREVITLGCARKPADPEFFYFG